jgi:hypothetical protein
LSVSLCVFPCAASIIFVRRYVSSIFNNTFLINADEYVGCFNITLQ